MSLAKAVWDAGEIIGDGSGTAGSTSEMQDDSSGIAELESSKAGSSNDTSGISESESSTDGSTRGADVRGSGGIGSDFTR